MSCASWRLFSFLFQEAEIILQLFGLNDLFKDGFEQSR